MRRTLVAASIALLLTLTGCTTGDGTPGEADTTAAAGTSTPAPAPAPPPPDMRIEVDLAARQLHVIRGGSRVATHSVAVGSTEWPTRTGEWMIVQAVWNPEWNPPDESWAEEREPRKPGDPKNPLGEAPSSCTIRRGRSTAPTTRPRSATLSSQRLHSRHERGSGAACARSHGSGRGGEGRGVVRERPEEPHREADHRSPQPDPHQGLLARGETSCARTRPAEPALSFLRMTAVGISQVTATEREKTLADWFRQFGSVAIGFSGGVDSSYLAAVAVETLGRENALAIIGRSDSFPESQWRTAREVADAIGIPVIEIATSEMQDERYAANPSNRCYFCKSELCGRDSRLSPASARPPS